MNKLTGKIILWSILTFLMVQLSGCGYNEMVQLEEKVSQEWSQVKTQYQRRMDLIPNVVNTVKGYADFEKEVLTQITSARSSVGQMAQPDFSNPEAVKNWEAAQQKLSGAISRLLMVSENYPDLKANQSFQALIVELEGTENRIAVARKNFNEAVGAYNAYIKQFPQMIVARMAGFDAKTYFEGDAGNEQAPEVKF